nr:MBL fold metallo-hydrolase [Clostridia bacterium]
MTRKEYLTEKYNEQAQGYRNRHRKFYENPSTSRVEPFKIADNLYYVGDAEVCVHLIDTGDGLILLDSGFLGAEHLLVDSIWRLGFDPKNVRWIIHSHGHSDHFGASCEFRIMYGTKLAISRVDGEFMKNSPRPYVDTISFPYAYKPEFDYFIEDGEIFELGNTKIRCVLTPGHTDGVLSFFFNVTVNGEPQLAGMFGGAGVNAITRRYMAVTGINPDSPNLMLKSIAQVRNEPVTVHLGNHPGNNNTLGKRKKQLEEGGNPFVDENSWPRFLDSLTVNVNKIIKENEEVDKELDRLFGAE